METGLIQSVWSAIQKSKLAQDERVLFAGGFYLVHNAVFWGVNLGLLVIYKLKWFEKYKIQQGKDVPTELSKRALVEVFVSHVVVNLVLLYYVVYPAAKSRFDFGEQAPRLTSILWQIPAFMVSEDFFFYWLHRLLHHRSIYKYVHKKHHEFKVNIGIAAEYSHPIEAIFGVFLPFISGPLILKPHFLTFLIWLAIRTTEAIDAHSGYRFPFSPFQLLDRIQGGAERHEFHHSNNQGSYGSFFTFWDWFTGSDAPYRSYQIITMDQAKRQAATKIPRGFSLNLAEKTDRNIAVKLRDNVVNNQSDYWAHVTLNGTELSVPKDASQYGTVEIPESGRLKFTYMLVGSNGEKDKQN